MRLRGRSAGTCAPVGMSPRDAFAGGDIPAGPVRLRGYSSQNPCTSEDAVLRRLPLEVWQHAEERRAVVEAGPNYFP